MQTVQVYIQQYPLFITAAVISAFIIFRCILANHDHLLEHRPGEEADWKSSCWVDYALSSASIDKPCRQAFFVIPPTWLKSLIDHNGQLEGKIHCRQCNSKLGAYHWKQNVKCPCTASFLPAFYFQASRVDFLKL